MNEQKTAKISTVVFIDALGQEVPKGLRFHGGALAIPTQATLGVRFLLRMHPIDPHRTNAAGAPPLVVVLLLARDIPLQAATPTEVQ